MDGVAAVQQAVAHRDVENTPPPVPELDWALLEQLDRAHAERRAYKPCCMLTADACRQLPQRPMTSVLFMSNLLRRYQHGLGACVVTGQPCLPWLDSPRHRVPLQTSRTALAATCPHELEIANDEALIQTSAIRGPCWSADG